MGKIITIKNNKGGVGKTFLTTQLASGLALAENKVLILTSDSQNNVFDYLLSGFLEFKNGLKAEVSRKEGEYFRLSKNLYFLPLEDNKFSNQFLKNLPVFLDECREEYDYTIIDSTAILKLDAVFLEKTDSIIIPTYADEVTLKSVINLLKEVDIKKVKAIVTNRYRASQNQKKYYEALKADLKDSPIFISKPINHVSFLENMLDSKKSIWQFSNKTAEQIQEILLDVIEQI
ncbi:ParA family protein [uncultured Cetobacterium sp.]|uniref:ParA family protein n=1 Tax=uncultured Cetobacterium sp. TaxID=527638 RepID=UPI00262276C1|nr:ParA family protein [uncultured Cetobacterium sp.]